ncbi:MAG: hypothetical protein P0119_02475 [Nitrospira sp.]|nr:hypothetical protein [Nitrospira sp.]
MTRSEIAPGDVLILEEGELVPADARLIEAVGMRVDNAALTGESTPKRGAAEATEDGHRLELPNLVFAGTTILSGHGRAVVFATGMNSEFGKILALTTMVETGLNPLQKEIAKVTRIVAVISLEMGRHFFSSAYAPDSASGSAPPSGSASSWRTRRRVCSRPSPSPSP